MKAIDWAIAHDLQNKPVYNEYNFGGALIWRGIPTFIDGRTLVFGDLAREYFTAQSKERAAMIDRYGVQWLLLHPWLQLQSPNWEEVYKDDVAVIYIRKHNAEH